VPPVNAGVGDWESKTPWSRFVTWMGETFDGWVEFFGMMLSGIAVLAGGWGRVGMSLGLGCLAGGFGVAIEARDGSGGPFWMFVGAVLIGLVIPMGKMRN
jgi:hypothetical protein